jgi:hypothetical protein
MNVNNDYYKKYIKYKIKYLNLLDALEGGGGNNRGRSRGRAKQQQQIHQQRHQQRHQQKQKRQADDDNEYKTLLQDPILIQPISNQNQDNSANQQTVINTIKKLREKQANCIYQSEHDYNINEIQKKKDIMVDTIEKILPNIKNVDIENYINKSLIEINKIIVKPENERKLELEKYLIENGLIENGLIKKPKEQQPIDLDISSLFNTENNTDKNPVENPVKNPVENPVENSVKVPPKKPPTKPPKK